MATTPTPTSSTTINWQPFYQQVRKAGKSPTLAAALNALGNPASYYGARMRAMDLGCGEGRDTMELLKAGWLVTAVDSDSQGCQALKNAAFTGLVDHLLTVQQATFDQANYPKNRFDLINAYLALPYCPRTQFQQVWQKIVDAVATDGYLACNLFGNNHSYASMPFVTTFNRAQVLALLSQFQVVTLNETTNTAYGADGKAVTNHEFFIVAKKM